MRTSTRTGGCRNRENFTRAILLSGALAGLSGALLILGGLQHRFLKGMEANYGWDGVMIAIGAAGIYALFFAVLQTGAMGMELETAVPSEFVLVFQAVTVLFVVAIRESAHILIHRTVAALFALFTLAMNTDEFVTGIATNMLALGGTAYALRRMFQVKGALIDPSIQPMPRWNIPLLGEVLSDHPFMVYLSIAVVFIASYHLYMTSFGLRLRAVGEDSEAADSAGISSKGIKTSAILISDVLCALAGVFLSLGYVTLFAENMSAGRGWISLAVIILTRGRPVNVLLMVLVFGFFDGLGLSLQNTAIPPQS